MTDKHTQLMELTRSLGKPENNFVIIGEGNTSCRLDADTFLIKASGQQMNGIGLDGFVAVQFAPILGMLDHSPGDLDAQKAVMNGAKADPATKGTPSVEVTVHAMLLTECAVDWVVHTHAVAVNQILCSNKARAFAENRMFPDEAVLCGPESVFVPYVDPGLPLALAIRAGVRDYMKQHEEAPKVILLQNHGVFALGKTAAEAVNVHAMCNKAAQIFVGACAVGEPQFLSPEEVRHITRRPDEIYRRKLFEEKSSG
jgi:rhamnose utilization protein RhaD (predicted bifunctional aldolase and dehydrogenase)